jgi:hypothetical protein
MKKNALKFALPVGMGMLLTAITVFVLSSTLFISSCTKDNSTTKHCTSSGYPLYCAKVGVCCPAGYAYYCDGNCNSQPCPAGTVTVDSCSPE